MDGTESARVEFLRHTLATLGYRAGKVLRDAPNDFATVRISPTSRTPLEILAHIGDLLDWAKSIVLGKQEWHDSAGTLWATEVDRFFAALADLDDVLASGTISCPPETLFQGPIADALAHTGQLAMLRRVANAPIRGENYHKARIETGRVGRDQAPPVREFD